MGVPEKQAAESSQFHLNFVGIRHIGYAVSGISFLASLCLLYFWGLNYGVEFAGGSVFLYRFKTAVEANTIRATLSTPVFADLGDVQVQRVMGAMEATGHGKGEEYIIKTKFEEKVAKTGAADDTEARMDKALSTLGGGAERLSVEKIGPTVGASLKVKAFWCAFLGCMGILLYIAARFEFKMAVAAIVAEVHDCFMILGLFTLMQREFSLDILAALLTILGYSIHDSIIVLDRVRENLRLKRKLAFDEIVNLSINQTMSRTIITSLTVQLSILALLFIGPSNVRDFALAMTIGVVVGTYSSIFVVAPILVDWYYHDHPTGQQKLS
ncbi:MAG: protein translocase subunit SecF [Candidatus Wallbacteria bacterium]|nr:protein translocase subunit SecF [Candidatus Wallbacteria bacterium]